jgi:hypothetical protein
MPGTETLAPPIADEGDDDRLELHKAPSCVLNVEAVRAANESTSQAGRITRCGEPVCIAFLLTIPDENSFAFTGKVGPCDQGNQTPPELLS